MKFIFADTSYYQALISDSDEHYDDAHFLAATVPSGIITTEWVLSELLNTFSRGKRRRLAVTQLVDDLRASEHVLVFPATTHDWIKGYQLFNQRMDKNWSLV